MEARHEVNRKRGIIALGAALVLAFCFSIYFARDPAGNQGNGFPDLATAKSVIAYIPGGGKTKEVKLTEEEAATFRAIASRLDAQDAPKSLDENPMSGIMQCFNVELATGETVDVGLTGNEMLIGEDELWQVDHDAMTSLNNYYQTLYIKYI